MSSTFTFSYSHIKMNSEIFSKVRLSDKHLRQPPRRSTRRLSRRILKACTIGNSVTIRPRTKFIEVSRSHRYAPTPILTLATRHFTCCINRSQLSYGLTGLALIRADGAQPSLHLDEYVRVRTVYILPCGPLRKYN